jgi:hypothetical protein
MSDDHFPNDRYIDCGNGMLFPLCAEVVAPLKQPVSAKPLPYRERLAAAKITTSISELQKFASDKTDLIRKAVAENPATPDFLLEILAVDNSAVVRKAIVARSDVTAWLLNMVFRSSMEQNSTNGVCLDEQVVLEIVRHPQTPLAILEDVTQQYVMRGHASPLLIAVISHPKVTNNLLHKLLQSPIRQIRLAVARHAKNLWLLQDLLSDSDEQVRRIAAERLDKPQSGS